MRVFWGLLLLLFSVNKLPAQSVGNTVYSIMLNRLLSHNVREISVSEILPNDSVVFIDARERKEFDTSHIKGAIWSGYDDFDIKRLQTVPQNAKVVVYCSVGYRSEKIVEKLTKAGFHNVYNMYGGIFEWVNQKRLVVDNRNKDTNKIHAYNKVWGIWLERGLKVF